MKNILFIHGAWASPISFNYIVDKLKEDQTLDFKPSYLTYNSLSDKVSNVVETAKEHIASLKEPVIIVGHSLGGLIALALEKEDNVESVITISSPVAGIKLNTFFRIYVMSTSSIIKDVMPESFFIRNLKLAKYTKDIAMVASCEGHNDYINEASDGVISVSSQVSWKPETAKLYAINCNHFESLLCKDVVDIIKERLTLNE